MDQSSKIYIAGHNGMVGSSIDRILRSKGYTNIIKRTSNELDLRNQNQVSNFFESERPQYVILAAAKVGGILANSTFVADFIYDNLQIQNNVIHSSYLCNVEKLLFLGSSCIYPRDCEQPMKEEFLLTGALEKTNEPYAVAKISGIKLCESYNKQYGTNFISLMPTNLYGPNDNYDLKTSHVLPALIRKIHLGKSIENNDWEAVKFDLNKSPIGEINGRTNYKKIESALNNYGLSFRSNFAQKGKNTSSVEIKLWGTGEPKREFLHVDDLARACIFAMNKLNANDLIDKDICHWNVGSNEEIQIKDLASEVKKIIGFKGQLNFDGKNLDGTKRKLLDSSRLNSLGWENSISLKDGLLSTYLGYKVNT